MGALRDIDGVTRVAVTSSQRVGTAGSGGASTGPASVSTQCEVRDFITQFEVVVAFDKVQIDPTTGLAPATTSTTPAAPTDVPATGSDGVASRGEAGDEGKQVREPAVGQGSPGGEHPDSRGGAPVKRSDATVLAVVGVGGCDRRVLVRRSRAQAKPG